MARLRFDNQTGTLGATLTAGGLALTLASPWTAATVTGPDFVVIELEPPTAGVRSASYEVIYATPVNGSASAVITARGQEGTAAAQHNAGSVWSHGTTAQDFSSGVVFPLTAAGDMGFRPHGIANDALLLVNDAGAAKTLTITANSSGVTAVSSGELNLQGGGDTASLSSASGIFIIANTSVTNTSEIDVLDSGIEVSTITGHLTLSTLGGSGDATLRSNGGNTVVESDVGDLILSSGGLGLALKANGELRVGGVAGTSGQVLTSQGVGSAPLWATPSSSVGFPLTAAGDETFQPNGVASSTLTLHNNASAVNGVTITGTATGVAPIVGTPNTNDQLNLQLGNHSNTIVLGSGAFGGITATSGTGGVNLNGYVVALGGQINTPANPVVSVAGGSPLIISTSPPASGNPNVRIQNGNNNNDVLVAAAVASGVNGITITQATAASAPVIAATGSDSAIDLELLPKSTGVVDLHYADQTTVGAAGAASALPATPSKYIKIKSNGTLYVIPAYLAS